MNKKSYCTCIECPFKKCNKHPVQLKGLKGEVTAVDLYKVCNRYISFLLSNKKEKGEI